MVKPGGTGRPRLAISARLAPLPPSRSRMLALPSALPSPKVKTHLPDFATSAAGFAAARLAAALGAPKFLREAAPDLARTATDDLDFAATFFVFEAALAMATKSSGKRGQKRKDCAPYTTFGRFPASRG